MIEHGAVKSLSLRPLRFLRSRWPWRSLAYLLASVVPGALAAGVILLGSTFLDAFWLGVAGLALVTVLAPAVTWYERWRVRLVDPERCRRVRRWVSGRWATRW